MSGISLPIPRSLQLPLDRPTRAASNRLVVCVPVYNEALTVEAILDSIASLGEVDQIIVVDDGSTDASGRVIADWIARHPGLATLIQHESNMGYSRALLTGFEWIRSAHRGGYLAPGDVVATIDADGQHDPAELPRLLRTMNANGLDVLWARRDFSLYPLWKRAGNWLMSRMARVFSGHPFQDVESGYCLFRVEALEAALQVRTRDWRYSISLTLAVIMARLGFRISNEPMVSVPLYRSRTRMLDVFTDTLAAANAWLDVTRVGACRNRTGLIFAVVGMVVVLVAAALVATVAMQPIYLGYDSINNYVHVWFISHSIYETGSIPARIPWLDGGGALTFPYGFFPWTLAALFYPVFGDYATTWIAVLGFLLLILAVFRTRLGSNPRLLAIFLAFPALTEALLSFQVSFIWAILFSFLFVYALERRSRWLALVWLVLAGSTHLLIVGPIVAAYMGWAWIYRPEQRRLLVFTAAGASLPLGVVAWYALQAPSVGANSPGFLVLTTLSTLVPRATLFLAPFAIFALRQYLSRPGIGLLAVASFVGITVSAHAILALPSLPGQRLDSYDGFVTGDRFVAGATYRVLEPSAREIGHYTLVKAQAVLAQELFSESQVRRDWELDQYRCFLTAKSIDYVVVNSGYTADLKTNEEALLNDMARDGLATLHYVDSDGQFMVFDVRPAREQTLRPVRQCY